MIQEDKELLLKDISARLHYGVKCCVKNNHKVCGILNGIVGENIHLYSSGCSTYNISVIKPYLFPLSSMTEDEKKEYYNLCIEEEREQIEFGEWVTRVYYHNTIESIDWLNKNHFDYRGLIERCLAIPITKENNPYK